MSDFFKIAAQYVLPAFIGMAGAYGVAWLQTLSQRGKNAADSRKVNTSADIDIGEAWQKYAQKIQDDYDKLYEQCKDQTKKITALETENEKYRTIEAAKEDARKNLHESVDQSINEIKPTP